MWSFYTLLNKATLRQRLRDQRRAFTMHERLDKAQQALELLQKSAIYQTATKIGLYLALPEEFPTQALMEAMWQAGKAVYLPIIQADQSLRFAVYNTHSIMSLNGYGILEPQGATIAAQDLDLLCMPLVGFDLHMNRLGMGGGFYDRTLAQFSQQPYLLGLAFACQEVDEVPTDKWDIKLDNVLTEQGFVRT